MTAKFTVSGADTTITFTYTATTAKMQAVIGDCSEYLWDHGYGNHGTMEAPELYSALTNNQKLALVDTHIRRVILDAANTNKSLKAQTVARDAEELAKHDMGA